jgi:type I restriction enzyme, R subunit
MKSQNFEFLRAKRAMLADLAGFAERYAHGDPTSSLVKQRTFVEQVVALIYGEYRLRPPSADHLNVLMTAEPFEESVPEVVRNKLHIVRKAGNEAAHAKRPVTSRLALESLAELFDAASWLHLRVDGGDRQDLPTYSPPTPEPDGAAKAKEALEKLRLAEAQYQSVLAALEKETHQRLEAERAASEHATALAELQERGQEVASTLRFDEATTRHRLIDQSLLAAGWNVGPSGADTDEVKQEVKVTGMRSDSGKGRVDYVLYGDDGKPLAVVEAKRTVKDPREGAEQARMYADCLEQETGVRPLIFYTNGHDVYLWDDAQRYPKRKVYGFYSKDSLEYLVHQRTHKHALASVEPNLAIADRMYQLEAVRLVGERFTSNFRKALIVQATGTGKTRVAVSLCDVLMRAGWVKRILFLCDRKELRKQADGVFKEFMSGEPRVVVTGKTADDRNKRIYLATYPAMMKCYERFDVGFFDLVIADESHRSIYETYRVLFRYFDALEVGLTATPVHVPGQRDTYELFGCKEREPTASYGFQEAIDARPPLPGPVPRSCVQQRVPRERLSLRAAERAAAPAARGAGSRGREGRRRPRRHGSILLQPRHDPLDVARADGGGHPRGDQEPRGQDDRVRAEPPARRVPRGELRRPLPAVRLEVRDALEQVWRDDRAEAECVEGQLAVTADGARPTAEPR